MSALADLLKAEGACLWVDRGEDAFETANRLVRERGWGDGLPVVPPTKERVEAMLAYCDRPWNEPVGRMAPRYGEATPLRLAANAVMAGCEPQYFPLLLLAVEAVCQTPFNLYAVQATTHPCCPLLIFNGPIAREVGINAGHNIFGPGAQANATIGRALRLAMLNIGGARPGSGDMATQGSPAKYSYCIAENEAASPWEPLHVERGFDRDTTTVTVVGGEGPHNINDHESISAEGILATVAGTMASTGGNDVHYRTQQPVLVLGPEHAATIAEGGFSKAQVKRWLQEHAWLPLSRFSRENIERRLKVNFPERYKDAGPEAKVYEFHNPDDLIVIVAGGAGKHSAWIPTFGQDTKSVTLALKLVDGRLASRVEDFRQG